MLARLKGTEMTAILTEPVVSETEQRIVLSRIGWDQYEAILRALPDQAGVKIVYQGGRLTLMSPSRSHDWHAKKIGQLITSVAIASGMEIEEAGHATFRSKEACSGVEADESYYLGDNAVLMRGPQNVNLEKQPPPDIVIEVEVTHKADDAVISWAKLGVPEVWRLDVDRRQFTFGIRNSEGVYAVSPKSQAFPFLKPDDVLTQLRLVEEIGTARWLSQLDQWVRTVLIPRRQA